VALPLHDKLMERSDYYRHCIEALMQRWTRSFLSIYSAFQVGSWCECRTQNSRLSTFCFDMPCRAFWILLRCHRCSS
jgi:hypothetical protein